jgi:uncharacterized membrane protein YesL
MGGLFNINNGFFRAISRIMDLILLNILWVITSIPIFTIGASTTAVYYVCMKMMRNEEGYVSSDFFRSFKQNFKQSTAIWLLSLLVALILWCDWRFWSSGAGIFYSLMKGVTIIISVFFLLTFLYIFPVQARFENKIKANIKNAFLLSIRHILTTIFMIVILCIMAFGIYYVPLIFLIFIIMGVSGVSFTLSALFNNLFNKYIPEEVLFPEDPGIQAAPEEEPENVE